MATKSKVKKQAQKIEFLAVSRLKPYEHNPRTHSDAQIKQIADSIREFGFLIPVLIDGQDGVIAGHGRILAAQQLGMDEVPCIRAAHLTEAQRRAYIIADNKLTESAGWDAALLRFEMAELKNLGTDLGLTGFSADELTAIFADPGPPETKQDIPPDPQPEAVSVLGDLWLLDRHRVLCGDATDIGQVERLIGGQKADMLFTDPPYGVSYADKNKFLNAIARGNRIQEPIEGDHEKPDNVAIIWEEGFRAAGTAIKNGAAYYVTAPTGDLFLSFMQAMKNAGIPPRHQLVWVKNNHVLGRSDYHYRHEGLLYGWRDGHHSWYGPRNEVSTWEIPKPQASKLHPTMKPVALVARALRNSTKAGDVVLDSFAGSGTTLMACEQMGRETRLMEISPHYTDVIVRRWQEFTGGRAVLEGDGRTFDDLAFERLGKEHAGTT